MNQPGGNGMWDEEDGFYYDLLVLPDGSSLTSTVDAVAFPWSIVASSVLHLIGW